MLKFIACAKDKRPRRILNPGLVTLWGGEKSSPLCKVQLVVFLEKYNPVVQELLPSVSARAQLASTICLDHRLETKQKPRISAIFRNNKKSLLCPDSREIEKQNCHSFRLGTEPFPWSSPGEQSTVRIQCLNSWLYFLAAAGKHKLSSLVFWSTEN